MILTNRCDVNPGGINGLAADGPADLPRAAVTHQDIKAALMLRDVPGHRSISG
jgi:hypothetical protein